MSWLCDKMPLCILLFRFHGTACQRTVNMFLFRCYGTTWNCIRIRGSLCIFCGMLRVSFLSCGFRWYFLKTILSLSKWHMCVEKLSLWMVHTSYSTNCWSYCFLSCRSKSHSFVWEWVLSLVLLFSVWVACFGREIGSVLSSKLLEQVLVFQHFCFKSLTGVASGFFFTGVGGMRGNMFHWCCSST